MTMVSPMGEVGAFRFWCQKVLPAVYDDSLSYYELLAKVIEKLNEVIDMYGGTGETINYLLTELQKLQAEFEYFKEGGFEEYYEEQLDRWIHENMEDIISKSMRMVFFGLTKNGYFVAYIPDSWKEIIFDTGAVYNLDTYGRLILRYDVDSPNEIYPQEPEVSYPYQLSQLEYYITNIMTTLYGSEG